MIYSDKSFLSAQDRLIKRQEELALLMTEFFNWCRNQAILPGSKLGRAIEYSLKYEETFKTILEEGELILSNNLAERAIKSLKIGYFPKVLRALKRQPLS